MASNRFYLNILPEVDALVGRKKSGKIHFKMKLWQDLRGVIHATMLQKQIARCLSFSLIVANNKHRNVRELGLSENWSIVSSLKLKHDTFSHLFFSKMTSFYVATL